MVSAAAAATMAFPLERRLIAQSLDPSWPDILAKRACPADSTYWF
jgi:hypothetical protein